MMEKVMQKYGAVRNWTIVMSGIVCLAALGAIALKAGAADLTKQPGLTDLEGKWTLVKADMQGQPLLSKDKPAPEITIQNGKLTSDFKRAAGELPIDLTKVLDPTKTPKLITLPVLRRVVFNGIYEVNDSQLRIRGDISRGGHNAGEPRPTDFSDNQGVLLVFQREK
jgi:uncharacterized protein (TIGR03067 family)